MVMNLSLESRLVWFLADTLLNVASVVFMKVKLEDMWLSLDVKLLCLLYV
jgi:hypothetical protein